MFDHEGYTYYLRQKIRLENRLSEIGDYRGSVEIESQMQFIEDRLVARIKQAHYRSMQEMDGLRLVLIESTKPEPEMEAGT